MRVVRYAAITHGEAQAGWVPHSQMQDSALDGEFRWTVEHVITNAHELRAIRKRLRVKERKRRRAQAITGFGRRVDVHGQHRVIVELSLHFELGDWRHEPMWDTVQL